MKKPVWIAWEPHTRSRSMAASVGADLYEISHNERRFLRYLLCSKDTVLALKKVRPEVIFFQNPSIVLSLFLVFYKKMNNVTLIMDAHNAGIWPLEGRSKILTYLSSWIIRRVDLTIVTNSEVAAEVESRSGHPFILTDPIPSFSSFNSQFTKQREGFEVIFICTWSEDEPVSEVIEAARLLLRHNVIVKVTGKIPEKIQHLSVPENVVLTGFLSDQEYQKLLACADLAVDLTTRESCLVCGSYESIAVGTPCVLSSSRVNREIFKKGFVFTENDRNSIAKAIIFGLKNKTQLRTEIKDFHVAYEDDHLKKIKDLSLLYN